MLNQIIKNKLFLSLSLSVLLVAPLSSKAARVAVTDSGTDFSHEWLKDRILFNSSERQGNLVDDDRNGKVDDLVGWNFVEDYRKIFFPEHLKIVDDKLFQIFEVISRIQGGTATDDDKKFLKENIQDLDAAKKQAVIAKLNFYGQYAHSTHVSGIIASVSPESRIMSNRVFPDTPPVDETSSEDHSEMLKLGTKSFEQVLDFGINISPKPKFGVVDIFYKIIAAVNNGSFERVAQYTFERKIDIANYSLGASLQNIAKLILGVKGVKAPTAEQLSIETKRVSAQFEPMGQKWMKLAPQTLFVIAAGNDNSNNDILPVFPANVKADNSLVVAATKGNSALADFSNYGELSVDIAAPGVAIVSSVPSLDGKKLLPMSGTSMAAPYVTGVAAKVKDLNPSLSSLAIKTLLMATVDKKEWLKTKVISSGVINPQRAYFAAEKSKVLVLSEAIELSKKEVQDLPLQTVTTLRPNDKKNIYGVKVDSVVLTDEMKSLARDLVF